MLLCFRGRLRFMSFEAGAVRVNGDSRHSGVDCEVLRLDFKRGNQLKPEHFKLNPNNKMPTLEDEGFVLWESNAILFYVAGKHPEKALAF
jgi:glutathione S-transferase